MTKITPEVVVNEMARLCDKQIFDECRIKVIEYLEKGANVNEDTKLYKRQFNEILLLCNETRVTDQFFDYFVMGDQYLTIGKLRDLIDRFRKHAMLEYGNFRFAFKELSRSINVENKLKTWLRNPQDIIKDYKDRPPPILNIKEIPRNQIHKLGYLTKEEADEDIISKAIYNTDVYLSSDHLDVYVATSMRDEADYQTVFDLCNGVFSDSRIEKLNLRYFDPTQSFHKNRVAKGLIEGLMLKRAKCTIYAAQESDSFGKDSELAATLAQGKPVIAYIPRIDPENSEYISQLIAIPIFKLYDKAEIFIKNIRDKDWDDFSSIISKMDSYIENNLNQETIKTKLGKDHEKLARIVARAAAAPYDHRADIFQWYHPLGLQVHLETGVANGLLIARTFQECADLLHGVLTNGLEFDIVNPGEEIKSGDGTKSDELNFLLLEKKSNCVFRVVTTDKLLTNSFWNFYLKEGE